MSNEKFPGVDEFSSHRIRRDVKERHPDQHSLSGEAVLVHEIRGIQEADAIRVFEEIKGEPATDGEAFASVIHKRAQVHARLDHLGDFHGGMSTSESEAFLRQIGFKQVLRKEKRSGVHQAWADPLTGIMIAGEFGGRRTDLICYFQFSPNVASMTEKEESDWNILVDRIFGGYSSHSWFNPKRPALHHGELHYARSYPDLDAAALEAWNADFLAIPESVLSERGQWVMVVDGAPTAGLHALMATLHRREVRFEVPWHPVAFQECTFKKVFACEENEIGSHFRVTPEWFQEIYAASVARVLEEMKPTVTLKL